MRAPRRLRQGHRTTRYLSKQEVLLEASRIVQRRINIDTPWGKRQFVSMFGCTLDIVMVVWKKLVLHEMLPNDAKVKHLLWCLSFLKVYGSEYVMSSMFRCTEKTMRKWVWLFIDKLSSLEIVSTNNGIFFFIISTYPHTLFFIYRLSLVIDLLGLMILFVK